MASNDRTLQPDRIEADALARRLIRRIGAARLLVAVSAAVFLGLVAGAGLGVVPALAGFAAISGATCLVRHLAPPASATTRRAWLAPAAEPGAEYAAMAARLPDPCFVIDRQGRVRFQNAAGAEAYGPIDRGQPISFLLRAPEVEEAIRKALVDGVGTTVTYYERVPTDRWFEASVAPLETPPAGRERLPVALPPFVLVLLRDLTAAQRVERMRVDFVANVSHELKTPLASLTGFIETLQGSAKNDAKARERFLEVMAEQARRMSRLIDDLMSLSRIELKAHVRPETVVDLNPIVEHVVDAMHPLARESAVEMKVELSDASLNVIGDRDELAQVLQNLVHNAIKYGHSGGRIEVSALRQPRAGGKPDLVLVSVHDHGPGITPEHLPRLTERFYRVDAASSREKGGTGLGLAIVKHIMTRHRGHLSVESEPGQGAVFTIQLDAADVTAESVSPQSRS